MRAIQVTFALFLGVAGIFGCAARDSSYPPAPKASAQIPSAPPLAEDFYGLVAAPPAREAITPDSSDHVLPERESQPARTAEAKAPPSPSYDASKENQERGEKRENPLPIAKPAPAVRHPARALQADNRLLELLEKDLDKAVEQVTERRRLEFSKEVIDNPQVRHFIKYYSKTGKTRFSKLLSRSGRYMPMIAKVLRHEGLPEELGYLALLESEFRVNATSRNGAVGLWQFIEPTGRRYGLRIDEWVDERRDPVKSTRAAAAYLKDLHDYFGRWFLATAAYNAGPGTINKALQQSGGKTFFSIKAKAQLSEETRNFVPKFIAIALIAMDPKKYGFDEIQYEDALDYEEIELKEPMHLAVLAQLVGTSVGAIQELNPALLQPLTPPGETPARVNLPVGKAELLLAKRNDNLDGKEANSARMVTHEVKKGETLLSIARHYGLEVRALMEFNSLKNSRLRIGQKLNILLQTIRRTLR